MSSRARNGASALGMATFALAGLAMLLFEFYWFHQWWGGVGVVVAFVAPPIAAAFPLVYLFMEGWSWLYFGLWGVGIAGAVAANGS